MNINCRLSAARAFALGSVILGNSVAADVTVEEQTTIHTADVAARGTSTIRIADGKQRREMEFSCEGSVSPVCERRRDVDIIRLDRGVTWIVESKQKRFTESPFPSLEQTRAMREHQQAVLDKLKSCPQAQQSIRNFDTSNCEMSTPVLKVDETRDSATLLGHEARRTNVLLTQSCKIKQSADVCRLTYSLDVWVTQDELPGFADREDFQSGYRRRLGIAETSALDATPLNAALAPYADSLRKLSAQLADSRGYPLKAAFRYTIDGEHCGLVPKSDPPSTGSGSGAASSAGQAAAAATMSSAEHAAGWGTSDAVQRATGSGMTGYVAGSAAGAFTQNLVGGLFAKRKQANAAPAEAAPASVRQSASAPGPAIATVAEISVETTAIDTAPISAGQFEIPAGWKKMSPRAGVEDELPKCPR